MDKLYKAKQVYNSIEIPPELNKIVESAIEESRKPVAKKVPYIKILAPVAACAAICIALGAGGLLSDVENEALTIDGASVGESEISIARAMPEAYAKSSFNGETSFASDTPYSTMVSERVESERQKGRKLELIYMDETFAVFKSVSDDTDEVVYCNFRQSDGEDVTLSELGITQFGENVVFYINSKDSVTVIENGSEKQYAMQR